MAMGKIIPLIAATRDATKQDVYDIVAGHFDIIEAKLVALQQKLDQLQDGINELAIAKQPHKNLP
jgi:hypothetical protein